VTIEAILEGILTNPAYLAGWAVLVAASLAVLVWDIRANNADLASLMQFVWGLTVLYSGPLGLAMYWYSGRAQISHDSLWRKGCRSVAHCYSGCGAGEVIGVTLAAGLLALGTSFVIVVTFAFAYAMGYALTVGPLMQEGVGFGEAAKDALLTETPSITVMEMAAIGTDVWLAGEAHVGDLLFWSGLAFSLTIGLAVAYPVNAYLVHRGVKGGMQDPTERRQAA
jgi:hypothetical protein